MFLFGDCGSITSDPTWRYDPLKFWPCPDNVQIVASNVVWLNSERHVYTEFIFWLSTDFNNTVTGALIEIIDFVIFKWSGELPVVPTTDQMRRWQYLRIFSAHSG